MDNARVSGMVGSVKACPWTNVYGTYRKANTSAKKGKAMEAFWA